MTDIVLNGLIENFLRSRGLTNFTDSKAFEAFATSTVLRRHHQTDIGDIADGILVGGRQDAGLDAIAIIVNGRPANTIDDLAFYLEKDRHMDVEFAFIQAKKSSAFDTGGIAKFAFGVEEFFKAVLAPCHATSFSEEIQARVALAKHIYEKMYRDVKANPTCSLYYVTTGKWKEPEEPARQLSAAVDRLKETNLFTNVIALPIDAEYLKNVNVELERAVEKTVEISRIAVFPQIGGVEEAYIGLLSGDQFIELVSTEDGDLNKELFYDNVRDFQGYNPVNAEIEDTLKSDKLLTRFPLLNNGMTIVARAIKRTADMFHISDFQVVNGCQTAHVLFNNKERVGENIFIPVKIVVTNEWQTINDVIKATNRQTPVLPEALESLTPFHRGLEQFYFESERHLPESERIYYERRSKQYAEKGFSSTHVVTLTTQIKSFVGMYFNEPHRHPGYYGELLKAYKESGLFALDHRPHAYYSSGVAMHVLEKWLSSSHGTEDIRFYKYHLLYIVRVLVGGGLDFPRLNSKHIDDYALRIAKELRKACSSNVFEEAAKIVHEALRQFGSAQTSGMNPPHRLRDFTAAVTDILTKRFPRDRGGPRSTVSRIRGAKAPKKETGTGVLKFFNSWRRYGFIARDDGGDLFVHEDEMRDIPWSLRRTGTRVSFSIGYGSSGPFAQSVEVVEENRT